MSTPLYLEDAVVLELFTTAGPYNLSVPSSEMTLSLGSKSCVVAVLVETGNPIASYSWHFDHLWISSLTNIHYTEKLLRCNLRAALNHG